MLDDIKKSHERVAKYVHSRRRSIILKGLLFISVFMVIFQFLFPVDRMLPFTKIDGVNYSLWSKDDVIDNLEEIYNTKSLSIYFGSSRQALKTPLLNELGLNIDSFSTVSAIEYPWYYKIIPFSLFKGYVVDSIDVIYKYDSIALDSYLTDEFGDSCSVEPRDAKLYSENGEIKLSYAQGGGDCEVYIIKNIINDYIPKLADKNIIKIEMDETPPLVNDYMAVNFRDDLLNRIGENPEIQIIDTYRTIKTEDVIDWLEFSIVDNKFTYDLSYENINNFLLSNFSNDIDVETGVTEIYTDNFIETSRTNGVDGKSLVMDETLEAIRAFIDSDEEVIKIAVNVTPPTDKYVRTFSENDETLTAIIEKYTSNHTGVYGVSLVELDGKNRRASFNDTKVFTTASTYKLFVAYSSLLRIEDGIWDWSDNISNGRNLETCLSEMIMYSDNECGIALINKIGRDVISNEAQAAGCTETTFLGAEGIETTPANLSLFLAQLKTGQILNLQSSRDFLMDVMNQNIYRLGIPQGLGPDYNVSNKVGFLYDLLHDASIVDAPDGSYILVIMTDGSSWEMIADLAEQIEFQRIK